MLDITLLIIGKVKEKYWQEALAEYSKRLSPYVRLRIKELAATPFSENNKIQSKELEAKRIVEYLESSSVKKNSAQVYLLAERGKMFNSPDFALWLEKTQPLVLVLGGTLGFSDELYRRYPQISLSPLTFPHELARVVVLEQIYRATTMLNNKNYHY